MIKQAKHMKKEQVVESHNLKEEKFGKNGREEG